MDSADRDHQRPKRHKATHEDMPSDRDKPALHPAKKTESGNDRALEVEATLQRDDVIWRILRKVSHTSSFLVKENWTLSARPMSQVMSTVIPIRFSHVIPNLLMYTAQNPHFLFA